MLFILSATSVPCIGSCGSPSWKGDDYCDDQNNNCGCDWDGGDCCGSNVNTNYCSVCECLDPYDNSGTESSTISSTIGTSSLAFISTTMSPGKFTNYRYQLWK